MTDTAIPAPQRTGPRTETVVVVLVVVLVLVALLLRVVLDGEPGHRAAVDRGGRDEAVLTVAGGADAITVTTGDLGGDLAVVTTPDGSRARPVTVLDGDDLAVRTEDADGGGGGPVEVTVRLERDVRWDVVVAGGSQRLRLDLSDGRVRRVEVRSGQGSVDAALPRPDGLLTTVLGGGAGTMAVHVPDGVPARVDLRSGAGTAALDGDRRQGIAAGTTLTSPDWTGEGDRVAVEATSGVGTLTLDRQMP